MSTTRIESLQPSKEEAWKSSIAIAFSFYVLLIAAGFSSKTDALLALISQGETIAIAAAEIVPQEEREIELDLAPPPPPEAHPDFIKPEEAPKPRVVQAPKPKPEVVRTETPKPAAPTFAASSVVIGNKNFPKPPYPIEAKLKKFQGTVVLSISVSGGSIQNVSVASSSGYGILDSAASRWVQSRWKFPEGITRNLELPIKFELSI